MPFVDPRLVVVRPELRQRQHNLDYEEMVRSIETTGQINAIVTRQDESGNQVLVAGWRRLMACRALEREVEFKDWSELDPIEAEVIELEENIKRAELHWKDQVLSARRIHELYLRQHGEAWSTTKTAERLSVDIMTFLRYIRVARGLEAGRLSAATGIMHADGILQRIAERRSESVVSELIAASMTTFGSTSASTTGSTTNANSGDSSGSLRTDSSVPGPGNSPLVLTTTDVEVDGAPAGSSLSGSRPTPIPTPTMAPNSIPASAAPILCANFNDWAQAYTGPKFNLIHCDFPYGVFMGGNFGATFDATVGRPDDGGGGATSAELYDNDPELYLKLLETLTSNMDRFVSYSAHFVFWYSMKFYSETVRRLRLAGLFVHDHPLVWHKSDGRGIAPGQNIYPKRTYDTALLASRGNRPLVKQGPNSYAAPCPTQLIHPSEKSTPMLKYFLTMLVDETTTVFDPTCGSGAALRAAEDLGAKAILGLELNPEYAKTALEATLKARAMRSGVR